MFIFVLTDNEFYIFHVLHNLLNGGGGSTSYSLPQVSPRIEVSDVIARYRRIIWLTSERFAKNDRMLMFWLQYSSVHAREKTISNNKYNSQQIDPLAYATRQATKRISTNVTALVSHDDSRDFFIILGRSSAPHSYGGIRKSCFDASRDHVCPTQPEPCSSSGYFLPSQQAAYHVHGMGPRTCLVTC